MTSRLAALAYLLETQDANGGFGFTRGGQASTEPTAYAVLCLHDHPDARARAVDWLRGGQHRDGGWGVGHRDGESGWTTALGTWALARVGMVAEAASGARWLMSHRSRAVNVPARISRLDGSLRGWSWTPDTFGWVPPTAFAILALNSTATEHGDAVAVGQSMLLDRSCSGGGWNYGNTTMISNSVPASIPETGQVLLALASVRTETADPRVAAGLEFLRRSAENSPGPLSLAWAVIGLRAWKADGSVAAARLTELQGPAGDWADSPWTTAIGALALDPADL